ncbi:MAG: insulinase family protein [Myxococcaceae bacterium]|nr:insulinase family protein [Myxococcaceae bacterium]
MRTLLLSLCLALPAAAQPPPPRAFPWPITTTTLRNGLTVMRVPFASPGLVAYYTVVRVGSRNEVEPGHTGFAHFFEHMMFRGTKRFPEGARSALLGKLGFTENAFTSDDVTVYTINGPATALDTLVDVEADRFRNLEYAEEPFKTEAAAVLGEYNKNAANPALKIEEAVLGAAFSKHPYQHTTLGFVEDIRAMPTRYEYSKQFFKRWYTPDNCVVVVVGDFDDAKLMKAIEAQYGPWTGKAAKLTIPAEPPLAGPREAKVTWTSPTLPRTALHFRTPASTLRAKDGAIMTVLAQYLAGPTSPLFKSLVLDKQLVDRLDPSYFDHRDPFLFGLEAKLKDERHRAEVNAALQAAIDEVMKSVDDQRLADIRDHLRFGLLMQLESPDEVAEALAWATGIFGSPEALERQQQQLLAVTAKDLVAFAKTHLTAKNRVTLEFTVNVKEVK